MIPSLSSSSICFRISSIFTEDCSIGGIRFEGNSHFDRSISIVKGLRFSSTSGSELLNIFVQLWIINVGDIIQLVAFYRDVCESSRISSQLASFAK